MARLTRSERNEIVAAYRDGGDANELGRKYDVHPNYVRKLASRYGVPKRTGHSAIPVPRAKKAFTRPHSITPKHMGSGRQTIAGYLRLM